MGQEIKADRFTHQDEIIFKEKLREETSVLHQWIKNNKFVHEKTQVGIELEAWLVTDDYVPAPESPAFFKNVHDPNVVPEISKYNFEINSAPFEYKDNAFSKLESQMKNYWDLCSQKANELHLKPIIIGTLPTLRDHMLTEEFLSEGKRYHVLNDRVMELRKGAPIKIDIEGKDEVHTIHNHVITECAATSLQVHYSMPIELAHDYYNASIIASSFMAAISANSPYFFGKELWDESRIAIFEQSVHINSWRKLDGDYAHRVTLGNGYINHIMELFFENLAGHEILLPDHCNEPVEKLKHLKLQNGSVWRWNRPLLDKNSDGTPNFRMEFRVPSSGPSLRDVIANSHFQIALVEALRKQKDLTHKISFKTASDNFYQACKHGFDASITWLDGPANIQKVLVDHILPLVSAELKNSPLSQEENDHYFHQTIVPRVKHAQNGAYWQKAFVHTHGTNFQELLESYYKYQQQGIPVHQWTV